MKMIIIMFKKFWSRGVYLKYRWAGMPVPQEREREFSGIVMVGVVACMWQNLCLLLRVACEFRRNRPITG